MSSERGTFAIRIGFSAAAAVLILAGASLNVGGRSGSAALLAMLAGLFALAAGALVETWKLSAPAGAAAVIATLAAAGFDFTDGQLQEEVALLEVELGEDKCQDH